MSDIDILNYALTLEHLETAMYRQVVASGVLTGRARDFALEFGDNEHTHAVAIRDTIRQLGGTPVHPRQSYNFPAFTNASDTLAFLITIEDTGVGAYLGQAANIQSPDILAAAASIYAVEALHTAALRTFVGQDATPHGAFEQPLTMEQVLAAAGPLLGPEMPMPSALPRTGTGTGTDHRWTGRGW